MSRINLSIIICTYNRCAFLNETLKSITNIEFENVQYEIIVVDNNSIDDTVLIVNEYIIQNSTINLRYVFESNQGLSNARNRGIFESKGEIITFIDDDVLLERHFIIEVYKSFRKNPQVSIIGGKVDLFYMSEKPKWINDELELYLSKQNYGEDNLVINFNNKWLVGANISFRREAIGTNLFNPNLGRKGSDLISGEETEFCKRICINSEIKALYCPSISLLHIIPAERMKKYFFIKRVFSGGKSKSIEIRHVNMLYILKCILKLTKHLIISILFMFNQKSFVKFLNVIEDFGELNGFFKVKAPF